MPNLLGYVFMSKKGIFGHCELCQSEGTDELLQALQLPLQAPEPCNPESQSTAGNEEETAK